MFRWVDALGAQPILNEARSHLKSFGTVTTQWFLYSLPDGLWVYSCTAYMILVWDRRLSLQSLLWLVLPISLAAGGEMGQALGIVPGTYDEIDLTLCFLGATAPFVFLIQIPLVETQIQRKMT